MTVTLWQQDGAASVSWSEDVWFTDVDAPRLCLVRVTWSDSSGTQTSADDAAMLRSVAGAERVLPFPYFDTTILSSGVQSNGTFGAGPSGAGACNPAWDSLVAELGLTSIFTALFGLGDLVVGFVPSAALPASGGYVAGCGRGGIGTFVDQPLTLAHEIGHLYGRHHVAVPGDDSNDPDYPRYDQGRRSIGEVGIDPGTWPPTLYDPRGTEDLMSYLRAGESQWISPYTYRAILDARGMHRSSDAAAGRVGRPLLVLAVRLDRDRTVHLRRVLQVVAPGSPPSPPRHGASPLSVDVLDRDGRVLLTHHLFATRSQGCCSCGGGVPPGRESWVDLDDAVEWPEDARGLAFHDGGEPLLAVEAGEAPELSVAGPRYEDPVVRLRVEARHPRVTPTVSVLVTADDGATWWPVALDPAEGEVAVPVDALPAGGAVRFRVTATAELRAAVTETEPLELPVRGPRLHLLLPERDDCPPPQGRTVLRARVDRRGGPAVPAWAVRWSSDRDGDLGRGADLLVDLSPGRHQVTATAPDGVGGTLSERAIIVVGG